MIEVIGLRSKMYSILVEGEENIKKANGIKYSVVKKSITFEDYRNCLENLAIINREQCNIYSKLRVAYTDKQTKIASSPHDDKRFILSNSINTLSWGHYRVIEEQMEQAAV